METPEQSFKETERYTIGQCMLLNHGKVSLPPDLKELFDRYSMPPCCKVKPYNNKYNSRFYPDGFKSTEPKRRLLSKKHDNIYSDDNILSNLRHAFGSVVKGDGGTLLAIAAINQILVPKTKIDEVAQLFFDTMIQSPRQRPEYMDILFRIENGTEGKVHLKFVKIAIDTFANPVVLKKTALESAKDRTRKHREATCGLFASLFTYRFSSEPKHRNPRAFFGNPKNLREKLLNPLFNAVEDPSATKEDRVNAFKDIALVWSILHEAGRADDLDQIYYDKLRALYTNGEYKLTVRLLLRDYVREN